MVTDAESPGGRALAPGGLGVVQDFVNTLDVEGGWEYLVRAESLAKWFERWGLTDGRPPLSYADLARARELREGLRALLLVNTGEALDAGARAALDRAARAAPLVLAIDADGGGRLAPAGRGLEGAFGRLLAIVATAIADGSWARLKVCRSDSCRWAFYDASKNRSGAWCTMAVCGNRNKVRAYQRRRRGAEE